MQILQSDRGGRLRLREAEAVYRDERERASRRWTFHLLRQERDWRKRRALTDAERARLNAVQAELRARGVVVGGTSC